MRNKEDITKEFEDDEDLDNIIELTDENGEKVEFEFLDLINYENEEYVVLCPANNDVPEVVILKVEGSDDDDEETYVSVDDDKVQKIFEIFKARLMEEFNCDD